MTPDFNTQRDSYPYEYDRLLFIYHRDGIEGCLKWAADMYDTYRSHVLHGKQKGTLSRDKRLSFIQSCCDFRRFIKSYTRRVDLSPKVG